MAGLLELLTQKGTLGDDMPLPESQKTINAQMGAVLDPRSAKHTMLVTPGSPMPSFMPPNIQRVDTSRGTVFTTHPEAAKSLASNDSIENMGKWVLGTSQGKPANADRVVRALDIEGTPVSEMATNENGHGAAVSTMKGHSPIGKVDVVPILSALLERNGLKVGK